MHKTNSTKSLRDRVNDKNRASQLLNMQRERNDTLEEIERFELKVDRPYGNDGKQFQKSRDLSVNNMFENNSLLSDVRLPRMKTMGRNLSSS